MQSRPSLGISYLLIASGILISALASTAEAIPVRADIVKNPAALAKNIGSRFYISRDDYKISSMAIGADAIADNTQEILDGNRVSSFRVIAGNKITSAESIIVVDAISDCRMVNARIVDRDISVSGEAVSGIAVIQDIDASPAVAAIAKNIEGKIIANRIDSIQFHASGLNVGILSLGQISGRAIEIDSAAAILPISERNNSSVVPSRIPSELS